MEEFHPHNDEVERAFLSPPGREQAGLPGTTSPSLPGGGKERHSGLALSGLYPPQNDFTLRGGPSRGHCGIVDGMSKKHETPPPPHPPLCEALT